MKKKLLAALLAIALVAGLAGCGDKQDPQENTDISKEDETSVERVLLKDLDVESIVTLGEYKKLEWKPEAVTVTDADVDELFTEFYLEYFDPELGVMDRAAVNGDTVNIDYEGKKDGVAFQGGTAQGANLTLGSKTFIDGFEDGLVGVSPSQTVDLNLTFPESYENTELAGQDVVFTVTVNYIIPAEPMEEAIPGMGIDGVSTIEELRQFVYDYLYSEAEYNATMGAQDQLLIDFVESCEFQELPADLVAQYRSMAETSLTATAANYQMDLETFVFYYSGGMDVASFLDQYAEETAKQYIAMQAVANKENLNVSDEELQTMLEEYATGAGYTTVEEYLGEADREDFREYFMLDKVFQFLLENVADGDTASIVPDDTVIEDATGAEEGSEAAGTQNTAEESETAENQNSEESAE